jgi:hypothetical protein
MSQPKDRAVSATYQSTTSETFTFTKHIPAPPSASTADRTAHLAALRQALSSTQDQINKELTERMEQDKARDSAKAGNGSNKAVDDVKEEENYGEEVQEED